MEKDRKAKVDALIANEKVAFGEDDREFLTGLDEAQFGKIEGLIPVIETKKEEPVITPAVPVVNDSPEIKPEPKVLTFDELVANASAEQRDMIMSGVKMATDKRNSIIEGILKVNSGFTKEELGAKDLAELEKLAGLAKVKSDFSANAGNQTVVANAEDSEVMEVPSLYPAKA